MELRLALAMRGGVSLAVWIGGAVSEIDLARRADRRDAAGGPDFWQEVLRGATRYDRVVVDVLAGASAGGLNGVLYAASQVYDFPYGAMRDVWLTVGGTEGLVRRGEPWPSLFMGDDYFLATVHQKLQALTQSTPAPADGSRPRVELALSATMMEPVVRPLPSPEDEPLAERRHAGGFRFRQPEEPWLPTDFPPPSDPQFAGTLWRLALAARSTSSYPGAFEAAEVHSSRRQAFTSPAPANGAGPQVDLDGMFLDRTSGPPFVVADGGILDNIPIQCALDFVANAPATGPTERFLVYLQPGASTSPKTSTALPEVERRTTMAVLRGVLAARVAGETINEDIAAMEAYNEAIARATTLRQATLGLLSDRKRFLEAAESAYSTYRLTRAAHEARQVFALLSDPMVVMGEDQFPRTVAGTAVDDARWRSPIAGWRQHDREGLEAALSRQLQGMLGAPDAAMLSCTGDVGPLLRVTDLLLEWTRWVERISPETAGHVKTRLYRARSFLGAILDRSRRLAWVSAAACSEADHAGFAARSVRALEMLTKVEGPVADTTIDALRTGAKGPLEAACAEAMARIDGVVAEAVRGATEARAHLAGADRDLLVEIAALLVELVAPLAAAPPDRSPPDSDVEPGQLLHRVLGGEPVTLEALEALDVLCLPEFVTGMPGRRRIDFRRLSTANRTPVAQHFEALLDEAEKEGLWWDPTVDRRSQQGLHVTLKLAGNELANFSAFLLAHWRANDWLWGRLDAVTTMIELLVRPSHLRARLAGCTDDDEAVEVVRRLVAPVGHPWQARLDTLVWGPSVEGVRREVAALRSTTDDADVDVPSVRTALIARRQWEILGEEQALPGDQMGVRPGADTGQVPSLEDVERWVAGYRVGAEVLRGNEKAPELLDRFGEIATAATEMALWNVSLPSSRLPRPPRVVATAVRRLGPRVGRRLAKGLVVVPSPSETSRTRARIALAVAVLVVLGVLGWFIDKWAFALGFVVAFLPLGALGAMGYRRLRNLLDTG